MMLKSIMKMDYKKFSNENYEMFKYDKTIIIKDIKNKKYYEGNEEEFKYGNYVLWENYKSKISNKFFIFYVISFILLLVLNISFYIFFYQKINFDKGQFILCFITYIFFNILLHELAHVISLISFNKKIDKIGFKFNYIFPAFYVRMNDVYMLTRKEKILVHSSGLYINLLLNLILICISYEFKINMLLVACKFYIFGIIMNTIPILNSDGYKVLISIFMYNEKKEKIDNSIYIKIFSYLNLGLAGVYLIKLIFDFLI